MIISTQAAEMKTGRTGVKTNQLICFRSPERRVVDMSGQQAPGCRGVHVGGSVSSAGILAAATSRLNHATQMLQALKGTVRRELTGVESGTNR